jgi:hypothetical protein
MAKGDAPFHQTKPPEDVGGANGYTKLSAVVFEPGHED